MAERRQLSKEETDEILRRYGMRCFIDGHPIETEDDLEFDHIVPVAAGGATSLENLAPVCRRHNRQKRTMSLSEYRDYLNLSKFFEDGASRYLDDVIRAKGSQVRRSLHYEIEAGGEGVTLYFDQNKRSVSLYKCPATGWQYFYDLIPVEYLKNDTDLQPRALRKNQCGDYTGIFNAIPSWLPQSVGSTRLASFSCLMASTRQPLKFGLAEKQ